MAYTEIDYGTETPQTIDRFGTQQEYRVWAVNGKKKVLHFIVPVVSLWNRKDRKQVESKAAREERRFWWSSNRYTGHRDYTVKLDDERRVDIVHSADGRVTVRVDGRFVYRETNRMRKGQRERVIQEYQSQEWIERELAEETREERLREYLEGRGPKPAEIFRPTEE